MSALLRERLRVEIIQGPRSTLELVELVRVPREHVERELERLEAEGVIRRATLWRMN